MPTAMRRPASLAEGLMLRLAKDAARSSTITASIEVSGAKLERRERTGDARHFDGAKAFIPDESDDAAAWRQSWRSGSCRREEAEGGAGRESTSLRRWLRVIFATISRPALQCPRLTYRKLVSCARGCETGRWPDHVPGLDHTPDLSRVWSRLDGANLRRRHREIAGPRFAQSPRSHRSHRHRPHSADQPARGSGRLAMVDRLGE